VDGLVDEDWGKNKFDFYTPRGAERLRWFLKGWASDARAL